MVGEDIFEVRHAPGSRMAGGRAGSRRRLVAEEEYARCDGRIRSLIEVLYDFGEPEILALLLLCRSPGMRVGELARLMGRERSTVQRILGKLIRAKLVEREAECCVGPKRGRYYVYTPASSDRLKRELKSRMREWCADRLKAIEGFEWPSPRQRADLSQ